MSEVDTSSCYQNFKQKNLVPFRPFSIEPQEKMCQVYGKQVVNSVDAIWIHSVSGVVKEHQEKPRITRRRNSRNDNIHFTIRLRKGKIVEIGAIETVKDIQNFIDYKRENRKLTRYIPISDSCFDDLYKTINKQESDNTSIGIYTLDELNEISKHIEFDVDEIKEFISRTPDKIQDYVNAIYRVHSIVNDYFVKGETKYFLKINEDPDIYDEYLKFIIRDKKYSMETIKKIDKCRDEFEKFYKAKDIDLFITTDFKPL